MSPPEEDDIARFEALVRAGDQRISGEILALRTRLIEIGDAVSDLRERSGLPAVTAPRPPEQAGPDVPDLERVDALRVPLVDLARRLENATESVRDLESFRSDLSQAGEAIGERVGARAEKSFRRLEEALAAMRMQLDSVAQQVRARPEAEFAASVRAQLEQAALSLRDDVVALGDDLRTEVTRLAEDLRREVAIEVTKELEELREPVRALREHAAALRQISGLDELAADLASVSRHLEAIDARIAQVGGAAAGEDAHAAGLLAAVEERFTSLLAVSQRQILDALDDRIAAAAEPGFLATFGEGVVEETPHPRRRLFGRRRAEVEMPESGPPPENFFSSPSEAQHLHASHQTEETSPVERGDVLQPPADVRGMVTAPGKTTRTRRSAPKRR